MGFKTGEPYKPLFGAVVGVVSDPDQAGSLAGQAGTSQPYGISGETRRGNEESPACPARESVRAMFSRIARRYDLINRTLSLGMDKWVRRKAAALASHEGHDLVLDLCTGTAAMALELARRGVSVIGVDFSLEMLAEARNKYAHTKIKLIAADAKSLPFRCGPSEAGPGGLFDLVTVAFGLRSMGDVQESLGSIKRTLRPGGKVLILEFGMPQNRLIRFFYRIYIRLFLPLIGGLLSGEKEAYKYLARSIFNFSENHNLKNALTDAGFQGVRSFPIASGIAIVYLAKKT